MSYARLLVQLKLFLKRGKFTGRKYNTLQLDIKVHRPFSDIYDLPSLSRRGKYLYINHLFLGEILFIQVLAWITGNKTGCLRITLANISQHSEFAREKESSALSKRLGVLVAVGKEEKISIFIRRRLKINLHKPTHLPNLHTTACPELWNSLTFLSPSSSDHSPPPRHCLESREKASDPQVWRPLLREIPSPPA